MLNSIKIGFLLFLCLLITACSANNENVPVESEPQAVTSQVAPSISSSASELQSQSSTDASSSKDEISTSESPKVESDTSATPDYQGLTQEQWNELQDHKENGRKSELDCPNFIHLQWEHSIASPLIDYVGANEFEAWLKATDSIHIPDRNIYSFSKYFSITLDELVSLIETNKLTHIYDIETVKRRYEYFNGSL